MHNSSFFIENIIMDLKDILKAFYRILIGQTDNLKFQQI